MKEYFYAAYVGQDIVGTFDTLEEVARFFGTTKNTAYFLSTPVYHKRCSQVAKTSNKRRVVYKYEIEEIEEDD